MTWLKLAIYGLACFRLAVMFSEDTGPARIFSKLRGFLKREAKQHPALKKSDLHHGIECLRCSSVWFACPLAVILITPDNNAINLLVNTLAISATAILINRALPAK